MRRVRFLWVVAKVFLRTLDNSVEKHLFFGMRDRGAHGLRRVEHVEVFEHAQQFVLARRKANGVLETFADGGGGAVFISRRNGEQKRDRRVDALEGVDERSRVIELALGRKNHTCDRFGRAGLVALADGVERRGDFDHIGNPPPKRRRELAHRVAASDNNQSRAAGTG